MVLLEHETCMYVVISKVLLQLRVFTVESFSMVLAGAWDLNVVISKVLLQLRVFTVESFSVGNFFTYAISHCISHILVHVQWAIWASFSICVFLICCMGFSLINTCWSKWFVDVAVILISLKYFLIFMNTTGNNAFVKKCS